MPKYTQAQLQQMAEQVLQARKQCDARYHKLLRSVSAKTGLSIDTVEAKILGLAMGMPS